jgi:hypothetical protein
MFQDGFEGRGAHGKGIRKSGVSDLFGTSGSNKPDDFRW